MMSVLKIPLITTSLNSGEQYLDQIQILGSAEYQ